MIHIDEKYKDASPQATVEHIHELLKAQDISLEEQWFDSGIPDCFSVRVTIAGTSLGTNGKGVTRELARASGCGELMERLQSGLLGAGQLRFPDEMVMTRQELLVQGRSVMDQVSARIAETEQTAFSTDRLLDHLYAFGTQEAVPVVPFMNADDGSLVCLPVNMLRGLYSSNGLAAGNSTEEAIVQGFSEIVERHCHGRILRESLVPPTVPEEYLAQFDTARSIIRSLNDVGYTVLIKDCSLGEGYPVVASVLIDKTRHGYRVVFGSSPVFEIALERSLTEQLQGINVGNVPQITAFHTGKKRSATDFEAAFGLNRGVFSADFFDGTPSYPFVPTEDLSNVTNKELVRFILRYLRKHGRTMLIRDLSHFGFPTFRMIVPGMSEVNAAMYVGEPSYRKLVFDVGGVARNFSEAPFNQLLAYPKRYLATPSVGPVRFSHLSGLPMKVSASQDSFWSLVSMAFAYWSIGNAAQSAQYFTSALPYAPDDCKALADCLGRFLTLRRGGSSKEQAFAHLRLFFETDTVRQLEAILNESNPFTVFLPVCDGLCSDCKNRSICKYPEHYRVSQRLNEAAAKFDATQSFDALRDCFDAVRD